MKTWRDLWRPLAAIFLTLSGLPAAHAALPIEQWQLDSGAQVYLVRSPGLPMLDVQIDVDGGSRRDPERQAGLAQATALMFGKGVAAQGQRAALDENALVEAWADLGAQFGASATGDRLSFRLRTLTQPDILRGATELAARQLAAPSFPQPVWQRDRDRLVAAWREAQTQPGNLAERRFSKAVYGNHPYGQEASPKSWGAIDAASMRTFYRQHARACGARVTLVGAIDREGAQALVDQLLAAWKGHGCASLSEVPEVKPLQKAQDIREPFAAAQAQVLVGQPGIARSDPDFLPLLVGNHILGGGGFNSRLMKEIREKRGLTYGVYSSFMPGRHAGAFTVSMQTRPDQAGQAVGLIHDELQRFVKEGPSDEELEAAKQELVNGFALRLDSNRKLLDNVASLAWNGLPLDYLDTWTTQVQAITREQVVRAFQRVLQPDRMVTVVVGGAQ
jgi:zinc protease